MKTTINNPRVADATDQLLERAMKLGLHGVVANWQEACEQPWVAQLIEYAEGERTRRSLERRLRDARIGAFKPMADFDWSWPKKLDRSAVEELFTLQFLRDGVNAVLLGPNGVGKTMTLKNLAQHALLRGFTVRFTTASEMLGDLASRESSVALNRRLARYCNPQLLCVDEVGYLSYDNRYADLLFEVVTRRYQAPRSIILTTNKPFAEWPSVFPNAACVVTLVDRLMHRCELIDVQADSYRLKEATERAASKAKSRTKKN
jgi:DNA replication protein DnaC